MKKRILCAVLSAGLLCTPVSVSAMHAVPEDGPIALIMYDSADAAQAGTVKDPVEVSEFVVCGYMQDGVVAIKFNGSTHFVREDELREKAEYIPLEQLPDGRTLSEVTVGMVSDNVKAVQENLIKTGYLKGEADGDFGAGSSAALKAFQEEHYLEGTGVADVYTQMVLQAAADGLPDELPAEEEVVYNSPEEKFPQIIGLTSADLLAYMDPEWRFSYDEYESFGTIDPSIALGTFQNEEPAVDRIALTVSLKAVAAKNAETGEIEVSPCVVVESEGAYRPYLQSVFLKNDSGSVLLDGGQSRGGLDGVTLMETGYVPLTQEALDLLSAGNLSEIMLSGTSRKYTVEPAADADSLKWFAESVKAEIPAAEAEQP